MKKFNTSLIVILLTVFYAFNASSQTVVDIIVNSADHDTLEAAVIAAELDDDLAGTGPFTAFAPTDAAFAALPEGTLDALLADPTGDLADILLYHVVSGKVMSTDLSNGMTATTLLGKDIEVTIDGANVYINDAMVTVADIEADNGVVHVIDAVLIPEEDTPTALANMNSSSGNFSVYPNPATNYIWIEAGNIAVEGSVARIINSAGQEVRNLVIESNKSGIDLSGFNPGVYYILIENNNSIYSNRFVVR